MTIATDRLEHSFKLRFLRDVLSDDCKAFSDEEREHWKSLEADGYYPALSVRNPRKVLIHRYATMMFDDIYFVDRSNRWEHWDCSDTSEPTFSQRQPPPLKNWKGLPA